MDMRKYVVLTGMTRNVAPSGKRLFANLIMVDRKAKALWFDPSHVGIVLTTSLSAADIWQLALFGVADLNDVLIIEIGDDWAAPAGSGNANWLSRNLGVRVPAATRH